VPDYVLCDWHNKPRTETHKGRTGQYAGPEGGTDSGTWFSGFRFSVLQLFDTLNQQGLLKDFCPLPVLPGAFSEVQFCYEFSLTLIISISGKLS
jgi:hypothetical protein